MSWFVGMLLPKSCPLDKLIEIRMHTGFDLDPIDDHGLELLPDEEFYQVHTFGAETYIGGYDIAAQMIDTIENHLRKDSQYIKLAPSMAATRIAMGEDFENITFDLCFSYLKKVPIVAQRIREQKHDVEQWMEKIKFIMQDCHVSRVGLFSFFMSSESYTNIQKLSRIQVKLDDLTPEMLWRIEFETVLDIIA